ncbi:hypothetical protein MTP99_014258 [Tenebrio molitor]|nr:hypothetical protein MTP99_014258 [Tenebrio molitor]
MENSFKRVIEHIFDNWTGLKLAVDYGSAGSNSKEVATGFMNYMIEYCLNESNVDVDSIQEALDDVMDQEFDTICEDGSTKEIAILLYKFLELIKQGNTVAFDEEYQKLSAFQNDGGSPPLFAKTEDLTISPSEEFQGPVQIEEPAVNEDDEEETARTLVTLTAQKTWPTGGVLEEHESTQNGHLHTL